MSDSSDGGCGGLIVVAIAIWLLFSATGTDVKEAVSKITGSDKSGEDVGEFWVENYPWSHSEVDAVKKCILSIQSRNWDNYFRSFEPSTILAREEPGLPGEFYDMEYYLWDTDDLVGKVIVSGFWKPSSLTGYDEEVVIYEEITVVRARKGVLDDINVDVDVAAEGWFVAYTEVEKLPFDFSSQLPSILTTRTPTPTTTPTVTPTPYYINNPHRK